jgi:hypothetical protein
MTPTKRRYTFWINDTEAEGLRGVKAREGITESEQIRQAIRDWLRRKDVTVKAPSRRSGKQRKG